MRLPRVLFVIVVSCLVFAACGDADTSTSTTTAPEEESAPSTTGDDGGPDDTDDMDDMDDGDMGDGDLPDGPDDALVGPYCALSGQANDRAAAFEPTTATAAEAEDFYRSMLALVEQGLETAPPAVADALEAQRAALVQTVEVLEGAGWDLRGSFDLLTPIYEDPVFLASQPVLDEFDTDVCGFPPEGFDPVDPVPVDDPVEVPAEFESYCAASFTASESDDLPFDADAAQVEAYYRGLLADLDELARLAPPELAADLETIRTNFTEVVRILEDAEWDLDVGFPLVQEWASDPEISDAMDAAIERVEGFDADVCGITY